MNKLLSILFVVTFSSAVLAECSRWNVQTDTPPPKDLLAFLAQKDVLSTDPDCAGAALRILGHEQARDYVPVMIRFLTFRQKFYWEGTGFVIRSVAEIDHYPAAMALMEIGKPALPALLSVVVQSPSDSLQFSNAVNTIMLIQRDPVPSGIQLLRRAALQEKDQKRRANLDAAVLLAVTLCSKETRAACEAAGQETPQTEKPMAHK